MEGAQEFYAQVELVYRMKDKYNERLLSSLKTQVTVNIPTPLEDAFIEDVIQYNIRNKCLL